MALRVGIVNYLNSRPLAWGFLQGRYRGVLEAEYSPPAEVARRLAAGRLDAGLVPSIELQRIPDLEVLPGACVAAREEVRSVILLARAPLGEVRRVALDENSRTSAALVRILLAERWRVAPELVSAPPDPEAMLAGCEAALLIGDPALTADRSGYRVYDLAREWRALTGLPFVFAVWAARRGAGGPELEAVFRESLRLGLASLDEIVADAVTELGLERAAVETYLTENLSFELGPEELAALEEFFRRAHVNGVIEEPRSLTIRSQRLG